MDVARAHVQVQAAQHPAVLARVAKVRIAEREDGGRLAGCGGKRLVDRAGGGHLAGQARRRRCGSRDGCEDRGNGNRAHLAVRQLHEVGSVGGGGLRSVGGHDDGDAQLAVHAEERVQEVLLGHRVQLRGGLVEQRAAAAAGPARPPGSPSAAGLLTGRPRTRGTTALCRRSARPRPRGGAWRPAPRPTFSNPNASSCHTVSHTSWFSGFCAT